MATRDLTLVIETQDRASAQLRQLGQEVQRLDRQVQRTGGQRGGLLGGLLQGGQIGAGIQAVQGAIAGLGGIADFVKQSVFGLNSELERAQASYEGLTGSAGQAAQILGVVRQEAARGFDLRQVQEAGRTLVTSSAGSVENFRELLQLAEQLAVVDPAAGISSGAFAIREALSGDFQSLIERFEANRNSINRWRQEGLPNIEIVRRAIQELGGSAAAVERLGRTFESRQTAISNFFNEIRRSLGAGIFERVSDAFGRMVQVIADHGEDLLRLAEHIGQAIGGILQGAVNAIAPVARELVEAFAPGLFDQIVASYQRLAPAAEQTARAMEQTAAPAQSLERRLAEIGVQAAEAQIEADRLRAGYEAQLRPLERQLDLLRESADLQRIQNELASNRAQTERQRIQAELTALERAGAAADPAQEGLTARQRAIALAAQERRLRLEELNLTEQQRPAVQSLEQQRAALLRQQQDALAPLERQLEAHRATAAALQLERQQTELLRQDLEAAEAAETRRRRAAAAAVDPAELERQKEAQRKRGEEMAAAWAEGFKRWLDKGGGTVWGAIGVSLETWYNSSGRQRAVQVGTDIGTAMGTAILPALQAAIGKMFFPGGMPRVITPNSPLAERGSPYPTPEQIAAAQAAPTVTLESGAVQVNGAADPGLVDRIRLAIHDAILAVVTASAQVAAGPQQPLPGNVR